MRYGIFSDVHGNLEAFEVALDFYKKAHIDSLIYLGDIIGYGANPQECIELLRPTAASCIAGNHDWAAIGKFDSSWFNTYARTAILWTEGQLNVESRRFLDSLALLYREDDFICVHGSLDHPEEFRYVLDDHQALRNFSHQKHPLCFIGHSHRAESYYIIGGELFYSRDEEIKIDKNHKYIINVGSVGQPRDGDPRLCVCIYDSDVGVVRFIRLEYDVKKAANKILKKGLPNILASRLYEGR